MGFSIVPYSPFAFVRFNYGIGTFGVKLYPYEEVNYGLAPIWVNKGFLGFLEEDSGLSRLCLPTKLS